MLKKHSISSILTFVIPSFIGILLFMIPLPFGDGFTIPIAYFSNWLQEVLFGYVPILALILICLSFLGSLIAKIWKPAWIIESPFLNNLFNVSWIWFIVRALGVVFATLTFFQWGPEAVWSENTGGLLLGDEGLLTILFSVFLFAGFLMPLLLNYGLLDFFGALLIKVMRPLFKLPGRSSIDALASWIGDGTIGVLLTNQQYELGFYTKREAAVIGTTFSIVSITFSLVVIETVDLSHMFVPFYFTIVVAGVIAALIMPRIPPLSKKPDTFYNDMKGNVKEEIPSGYTPVTWGFEQAVKQAEKNKNIKSFFTKGFQNVLDMWLGVMPVVMAIGTVGLMLAEFTPIFKWLGIPFVPILELMQIPEAEAAAQTVLVGFTDMLLPSILIEGVASDMTRFIIAALSVSQLIYLSEVGGVLLGSKIPVSFKDLVVIFLLRTIITLPIITLIAHIIF